MAKYIIYEQEGTKKRKKVKEGFRWLCLLFGPLWFFGHGMVGKGLLWSIVAVVLAPFTLGIGSLVIWIITGFIASGSVQKELANSGWKCLGYEDALNTKESGKA